MSNQETATQTVVGGWSTYKPLTPNDQKVFAEALKGFLGVNYKPTSVATQIVAGINYRFKCDASMPQATGIWEAIMEIYAPLDGEPHITGIIRI